MKQQPKNIIFDIGNVFVRWDPLAFMRDAFPDENPDAIWTRIRPTWRDLNRGQMTMDAAIQLFHSQTGLPAQGFYRFCRHVMEDAALLADTDAL